MSYVEGPELCRLAIAKGNEENSDWINTVVGYYYQFSHTTMDKPEPFYSGMAIMERLLADFINHGRMPNYDMDLPLGFTKEARYELYRRATEFFKVTDGGN